MNKIRKGDNVLVLTGRDKGKRGDVALIDGDRVLVTGLNLAKKHTKPNPMKNQPGGIVSKEMLIHRSNVALFDQASGKADQVRIEQRDGKGVRIFKKSGNVVSA
jgi:large subunit ribosomal protein L24